MTTPASGRMLGRRPTDRRRLANTVRLRLTGAVPAHPANVDHFTGVPLWMLGGNDQFGTCGPTSIANYLVLLYWFLKGEAITVTDDAVFDLYRRSGNPGFDPTTDADDNGVDMTVMLSALVKGGIEITHADGTTELIKPLCYASVPTALDDLKAVTSIFGGVILAVDLDVAQQAQTDAHPPLWDYVKGSGVWGGHAIVGGLYTGNATAHAEDEAVISWQMNVGTTDAFVAKQLSEAYAVVFPVLWDSPDFQAGVDAAALAADYTAITGQPFPEPVPPSPAPPGPVPPPAPAGDAADLAFAHDPRVEHWADHEHHIGDNAHAAAAFKAWRTAKGISPS